ncbi:MAG: PDZ domain-containing protein, partial [Clostridia bacterium]|nr:PDZ domain-containing protein [Clostridia bacterium]
AGFRIDNKGAIIIGINDVITEDGIKSPSKDADVKAGDILLSVDGVQINNSSDIENALADFEGDGVTIVLNRGGEIVIKIIKPAKDVSGKYRLGMFVRDEITGIGTVTYIKKDLSFAALGHPVVDYNYQRPVDVNSGEVYRCSIIGVNKGERGKAGEIRGFFASDKAVGTIECNKNEGIFGKINDEEFVKNLSLIEVGKAKPGKASIYTTLDGCEPLSYGIDIVKVDSKAPENKNLVIKITDEKLISKTNGILQGMSGSPIVQNNKIVGAVTHVFLNDPSRGFGILIGNMLDA